MMGTHLRKEIALVFKDPVGLFIASVVPLLIVWLYSLLGLESIEFPDRFRETSPVALVLGLSIWLAALTTASTSLYRERSAGTLERLTVTPFSPTTMIGAKAVVWGVLVLFQSFLVWTSSRLFLQDQLGSAGFLTGWVVLASLGWAAVGLGILVSALLSSPTQVANAVTFLTLGSITFSGFFKPLKDVGSVGGLARLLPFTVGYRSLREVVASEALPLHLVGTLWGECIALLAVSAFVAKLRSRNRIDA